MHRWILAVLTASTVVLAGCSSSSSAPSPPDKRTNQAGHDKAQNVVPLPSLRKRVLTVSDLPMGWAVDNSKRGGSGKARGCSGLKSNAKDSAEHKQVVFSKNGNLPTLGEDVGYFIGNAKREFSHGNAALDRCTHETVESGSRSVTLTFGRLSFPRFGDESAAYVASGTVKGLTFTIDLLAVRVGSYIALLDTVDLGSADLGLLKREARRAVMTLR